eukprot:COSAG01_NODE_15288_length_1354_cov_1.119522_1_plen_54_part_10
MWRNYPRSSLLLIRGCGLVLTGDGHAAAAAAVYHDVVGGGCRGFSSGALPPGGS